jgi:hypothetical protein
MEGAFEKEDEDEWKRTCQKWGFGDRLSLETTKAGGTPALHYAYRAKVNASLRNSREG